MDDKKIEKTTDKNSSSDEAKTNNGRFPQRMQGKFTLPHGLRNEDKAKKSAQRKQKSLYGKDSKRPTIVPRELKDSKSKKGYLAIRKFNVDEISSSSWDESNASSSSTDNDSVVEKKVAHHNRKYSKKTKKISLNGFNDEELVYEKSICHDYESLNRKPKEQKLFKILLEKQGLDPNVSESSWYFCPSCSCDHASTRVSDSCAVLSTKFSDSCAVPSTSGSDSCAVPSTSSSDTYEITSTSGSDSCAVPSISSSDTYEITSTSFPDNFKVPSTSFSSERVPLENIDLIAMFGDLGFENSVIKRGNFSDKSSVETNISDYSDVESPTAMTHYTYRKRKSFYKSHRPIHEHDTELKKRRFETPRREPHMKPVLLPIRKYFSEEDVLIDAKRKLKISFSSGDDKGYKEIKKRPISEKEHSSPETQGSNHSFKKSKRFRIEENSDSEEEKIGLFTKSI